MNRTKTLAEILKYSVIAILVLLPFHAVLTTWLGSNFGHLDAWRIWKELLIALMVPGALYLVYRTHPKKDLGWVLRDERLRDWFRRNRLIALILAYVALHLLLGGLALAGNRVNVTALIYALLINLRFLVFFVLVMAIAAKTNLKTHWKKLLLWPALVVIIFGLLQQFVLPPDFLRHFGYGPDTIPAVQTVDEKLEYRRVQSTLRGANPLGAYLLVVITALAVLLIEARTIKKTATKIPPNTYYLLLTTTLLVLFLTYSRSAWLGTLLSLTALGFWSLRRARVRRWAALGAVIFTVTFGATVWILRDNDRLQNTLFHSDETSQSSESSNTGRARALQTGLADVIKEPFGRGPGTAGPASVRGDQPARIAENYYLQIAQEVGLLGLALFVAINIYVASALWQRREDPLALILLASLAGLTLINILSHAWTDDTLSLIWWGLAGIALAPAIMQRKGLQKK